VRAIASQEVSTVKDIGRLLRAGSKCGSCIPELNGLLAEHRPRDGEPATAAASPRPALTG
jgi:bacterioferritin-associated ferredoxin